MSLGSERALSEQGPAEVAADQKPGEATSTVQNRQSAVADEAHEGRLQRAAIVGQLVGGILHDFNNVLTVITGMIDLLSEAVADEPQLAGVVRLIDEAATRGATLTSRLMSFARAHPAQPRAVDVNALLEETSRLLRPTLGEIEMVVLGPADLPPVLADPGQLMTAILNLALAARHAMGEGGKLVFDAGAARAPESLAHARAREIEGPIVIAVDAHGYGEVSRHPERIFIDIDIARDLIRQCGGCLELYASPGAGARAEILLPKAAITPPWSADD
jgi:signal transduction histidine kinase